MILGTKARYAVMAMVDLVVHGDEKPVKLADIAARQEIPLAYLEQIFARLRQNGLVRSVKGPGGGYHLESPRIRLSTVIEAADESMKMTRCESHTAGGCMATRARCLTHDLWEGLGERIYDYFDNITLEDIGSGRVKAGERPLLAAFSPTRPHA